MKHFWTWFACGAMILLVVFALRRPEAMAEDDPRLLTKEDPEMALLHKDGPGVDALNAALKKKEAEYKVRYDELAAWELRLKEQENNVRGQIDELRNLQENFSALIEADRKRKESISADLVKTYETMSPKKASGVFSIMEVDLAADFLMNMKAKKVAAIFDVMDPEIANKLSSKIAARRNPAQAANAKSQAQGR